MLLKSKYIDKVSFFLIFIFFPILENQILKLDLTIMFYLKLLFVNLVLFVVLFIYDKLKKRKENMVLLWKMAGDDEKEKKRKKEDKKKINLEYEVNKKIGDFFEREKELKEKLVEIKNEKDTKHTIIEFQLKSMVMELEKVNKGLLYKEKIIENFIQLVEKIEQKNTTFEMFFEDLVYYFEKFFNIQDIIVIKQRKEEYEIFNKFSNEFDFEEEKISKLFKITKREYYKQKINREVGYEIILNLFTKKNKHGYILINGFTDENINYPVFIKLLRTISLELSNIAENLLYTDKIEKEKKAEKEEIYKLKKKIQEIHKNSDIQLEEMSNLYEEIVILHQAGKNLGKMLNKKKSEKIALEMILEIIEVEFGSIFYYSDKNKMKLKISKTIFLEGKEIIDKNLIQNLITELKIFKKLKENGKEIIINDITLLKISSSLKEKIVNILVTPIYIGKELIGGIILFNKKGDFTAGNKNLAVALTNQLASSIQNIDFLKQEIEKKKEDEQLKIANEIQSGLFPQKMPKLKKMEFFGVNDPAKAVGGDYYDLIQIDENNVIGVIADVSGKGIPAALLVSMFRTVFRMLVLHMKVTNPDKILYFINNILTDESLSGRFVTGMVFNVNSKEETIEFANAGHDPVLVYKSNSKEIIEYDLEGTIIGFMENEVFEKKKIKIEKGDIVVFYTDGVIEARGKKGDFFEFERLKKIIRETSKYPADYIGRKIHREINKFVADENNKNDDVTIITIKGVKNEKDINN
ncbi:MAG: hypothetical protein B6I28_03105 [Fusobacteriia bacterium 4572_132]|nr:MAG: hypothetical protein B6I28_03105 [Fusobacteriia bacterium 4572_132]